MDFYPTRYSGLSNTEINMLYRSDTWTNLSCEERLDALQELENRAAEELGNRPCEVCTKKMNGAEYGYYSAGQIVVNESLVNQGLLQYEDKEGNVLMYAPDDVNAQMMDTVYHENYHAYQNDVINNRLVHDNQNEVEIWRANEDMYISSSDNGILYRIQSQERTAFDYGELQIKVAFEKIEAECGEDAGYQAYLTSLHEHSYEIALTIARETYNDENIQETLDNYMLESYQENHAENSESIVATDLSVSVNNIDTMDSDAMGSTISSVDNTLGSDNNCDCATM